MLQCHVLGTHAAAFLFFDRAAVFLLRARGRGIPSALGFREEMGGRQRLLMAADASKWEFGGTSTNVLPANYSKPVVFDLAASAAGGRQYISVRCGRAVKVLGVKRVTDCQNPGVPKCKYVMMLFTEFYPSRINDIEQSIVRMFASNFCMLSIFVEVFLRYILVN